MVTGKKSYQEYEPNKRNSKNMFSHNVEILGFFYHSDFTWNQFWGFQKCKICHFHTFRGSEYWFP